jgi:hypothetical protein
VQSGRQRQRRLRKDEVYQSLHHNKQKSAFRKLRQQEAERIDATVEILGCVLCARIRVSMSSSLLLLLVFLLHHVLCRCHGVRRQRAGKCWATRACGHTPRTVLR